MPNEPLSVAEELTQKTLEYASAPPERKRDLGSSMISMLDLAVRHRHVMLIDLDDLRPTRVKHDGSRCPSCNVKHEVDDLVFYARQPNGGAYGPFHRACIKGS